MADDFPVASPGLEPQPRGRRPHDAGSPTDVDIGARTDRGGLPLRDDRLDVDPLFQLVERGALRVNFDLSAHWPRVPTLMARYARMDLADASIVVMSEQHHRCQVLTVDRTDFKVYRRKDRQLIDLVAPPAG